MFIVLLSYVKPLEEVSRFLDSHRAWVQRGFEDGAFVLAGRQLPIIGGVLIALGSNRRALEDRIKQDPFILHGVATAQIIEFKPSKLDDRLSFLSALESKGV